MARSLRLRSEAPCHFALAGDKSGVSGARFYKQLIAKADKRFDAHLARLKAKELEEKKLELKERK